MEIIETPDGLAGAADMRTLGAQTGADTFRRYRFVAAGMVASDAACVIAAMVASYLIRFHQVSLPLEYTLAVAVAPLAWVATFQGFGLYAAYRLSPPEEFRWTIAASSMGVILLMVGIFWSHQTLSRTWIGLTWVLAISLELVTRRLWRWYQGRLRGRGRLSFRTLIVGTNEEAGRLAAALRTRGSGYLPIGCVGRSGSMASPDSLPVVGRIDQLDQAIRDQGAQCVFVASTAVLPEEMLGVAQSARRSGVEVRVSANLPLILTSRLTVQEVGSTMTLALRPVRLTRKQALMKRVFDLAVASVAVLAVLPLWLLIAVAIRFSSTGPVLFRQARVTRGGRVFTMYKFRTMRQDGNSLLDRENLDQTQLYFKIRDDPRLTRVGRFLRRRSLDELPQLLNVLAGHMSIVGPRPLPEEQVAANLELLEARHEMLAGVTGWWQIHGRSDLSAEQAVKLDVFYIENWSLGLDLYILAKTLGAVVAGRGAI